MIFLALLVGLGVAWLLTTGPNFDSVYYFFFSAQLVLIVGALGLAVVYLAASHLV